MTSNFDSRPVRKEPHFDVGFGAVCGGVAISWKMLSFLGVRPIQKHFFALRRNVCQGRIDQRVFFEVVDEAEQRMIFQGQVD